MDLSNPGRAMRVGLVFLLWALAGILSVNSANAQTTIQSCFPSCDSDDGKFLSLVGTGMQSLSGDTITFGVVVDPRETYLDIEIFDGDTGGMWDQGSQTIVYAIFPDSSGNGTDNDDVATHYSSSMTDDAWYEVTPITLSSTQVARNSASGLYQFRLVIYAQPPLSSGFWSNFKVKVNGRVALTTRAFAFAGGYVGADETSRTAVRGTLYPNWTPATEAFDGTGTTYSGNWKFGLDYGRISQTTPLSHIDIWDGDLDHGSFISTGPQDGNDLNTPDGVPVWAENTPARPQGVAYGNNIVYSSVDSVSPVTGIATAAPWDDHRDPWFRRSPSIQYSLVDPEGWEYENTDPSGNQEWERFRVGNGATDSTDYAALHLPRGVWSLEIDGMDLTNLNAYRTSHDICGVDAYGEPMCPTTILCGNPDCQMAIGSSSWHSMFIGRNGVWTWGDNARYQLGLGSGVSGDRSYPSRVVAGSEGAGDVYLGDECETDGGHGPAIMGATSQDASMVLMRDGAVYAWGDNTKSQLGINSTASFKDSPVRVLKGSDYDGTTYLGDGDEKPVQVAMGFSHAGVRTDMGRVYSWGWNKQGECGIGSVTETKSPRLVLKGLYTPDGTDTTSYLGGDPDNPIIDLAFGDQYTLALAKDGTVYSWGVNDFGQLGDNSTTRRLTPVRVLAGAYASTYSGSGTRYLGDNPSARVIKIAAGGPHALALTADGRVWAWGSNVQGQLGTNSTTNSSIPVAVLEGGYPGATYLGDDADNPIVAIAAGGTGGTSNIGHNLVIAASGIVYSWGDNRKGQLGLGTSGAGTDQYTPQPVSKGEYDGTNYLGDAGNIVSVAAHQTHSMASTGNCFEVFGWGDGSDGRVGDSNTVVRTTPVRVKFDDALAPYRKIAPKRALAEDWNPEGYIMAPMDDQPTGGNLQLRKSDRSWLGGVHILLAGVVVDAASSRLIVDIDARQPAEGLVEVFSLSGERIDATPASVTLDRGLQRVTIQLPETIGDGMYLLRVSASGDTGMQRFVIAR